MKTLTRMKLVNWHRFENCTVEFDGSTLISGENGAGKTTLLDAVQFVLLAATNSFNKAAHENGKRKLTGYIRCKTGRENRPYERTGEISAHVALEFHEEEKDNYFILGAVVDSASEGQETVARYLIENAVLTDEMFFQGDFPRSIASFRSANRIKQWCKTKSEAQKVFKNRLGRLQDKFFRLIPKALAFKPIDDIKDFVYSYVLDEKEVDIAALQENVRTYQDLERTLESVKQRMAQLEQIEKYHREAEECLRRDRMYEYFLAKAEADITKGKIAEVEGEIKSDIRRMEETEREKAELVIEKNQKNDMAVALRVELSQDRDFLALEEQKKRLAQLEYEEQRLGQELKELKSALKRALLGADKLKMLKDVDPCIREYRRRFDKVENIEDVAEAKEFVSGVISYKNELYRSTQTAIAEEKIDLRSKEEKELKLKNRIADLQRRKLSYPDSAVRLAEAVKEEFLRLDRKASPRILCEMIDITDESWRSAIEGYLNTQRFYVLVEPDNFDIALGIYDRLRREKKVYGAGLINTQRMQEYDTAPEGTLATKVTSGNIYARRYINMVLGRVVMCDRIEDLKKYPVSITRGCMRYQNRVAGAINPEVFRTPYIGKQAYKVQLEQAEEESKALKNEIAAKRKGLSELEELSELLLVNDDLDVKYRLDVLTHIRAARKAVQDCRADIKTLEQNATLIHKQIRLEELEKICRSLDKDIDACSQKTGAFRNSIDTKQAECAALQEAYGSMLETISRLGADAQDELPVWERGYAKQTLGKTFEKFHENFTKARKSNDTSRQTAERMMADWMYRYKSEHDFGAAATMEGFREFAEVYDRLRTSELLEYEDKVETARANAESEFREQFLSKLQENMKQAQGEFRELNKALKDITFSNDRYEFLYAPSRRNRKYYEMIMDDYNVMQGESIFSGIFHEQHRAEIDELFERLADGSENSEKVLDEYTDYRTYMDYDIRIIHGDGSYSFYSKVCEEKSGGETQTPFYVTVAASFVQLYRNNIGGEAPGLVMFDEAFNNMDDERIGGVLEFMNRLPLQLLISAPPGKIQYIAPKMNKTLLIMTDGRVNYIENFDILEYGT